MSGNRTPASASSPIPDWLALVREKVEGLSFGVVQIVVHDRTVTQIERTEKTRLVASTADTARPGRRDIG